MHTPWQVTFPGLSGEVDVDDISNSISTETGPYKYKEDLAIGFPDDRIQPASSILTVRELRGNERRRHGQGADQRGGGGGGSGSGGGGTGGTSRLAQSRNGDGDAGRCPWPQRGSELTHFGLLICFWRYHHTDHMYSVVQKIYNVVKGAYLAHSDRKVVAIAALYCLFFV